MTADLQRLEQRIEVLTSAVITLAKVHNVRMNQEIVATRYGICRQTLAKRVKSGSFPPPGRDGKWSQSDLIEWENSPKFTQKTLKAA
jgi:predicted DNA-binding transcriptional regulator AlpA